MRSKRTFFTVLAAGGLKGRLKTFVLASFAVALTLPFSLTSSAQVVISAAPAGFDGLTNGFTSQEQIDLDRAVFEKRKVISDGLAPVYNAQSCVECHQSPVSGGISQVTNLRAGHFTGFSFVDHPGGSLISDRAVDALLQERVLGGNEVRTLRTSLNLLGDGFVECIDSNTLIAISSSQPAGMRGQLITVTVLEAGGAFRVGRFGWKNQHASLVSATVDEFLNQIGITKPLQPTENASNGRDVSAFDGAPDLEDTGDEVEAIARFLRSTKVPPPDAAIAATNDARIGSALFNAIGCSICHVRTITTAAPGTVINAGQFTVPPALGNKMIQPFSDFLLHDVGTGDGIVQNGGQSTRNKVRTPPLWGMRTRDRLMHDGESLTRSEAILRHAGEAAVVIDSYRALSVNQKNQLIIFLNSL